MKNIIEITDFENKELDIYARFTESQLLNDDNIKEGIDTFNTHEDTNIIFDFSDIFKESKQYDNI